jgi:lipoate-protein ligase A
MKLNQTHVSKLKIQDSSPKWRLIPSSAVPPDQMAYDRELFKGFGAGDPPLLRFFFFERPTLTLGRLEARRLNLSQLPFPHEIRPTGGRAVLHGEGDLCYSIVAPTSDPRVGGELLESYRKISGLLAHALRGLDREVRLSEEKHPGLEKGHCFSSPSFAELLLNGKKVAGGAQAREGNIFLQQGVILLSLSPGWRDLFPGTAESPMTGLNEESSLPPLTRNDVERAVAAAFEETGIAFRSQGPQEDAPGQGG